MNGNFSNLRAGDCVPDFRQASTSTSEFTVATAAGRYSVMCFFATSSDTAGQRALRLIWRTRRYFDDARIRLFGVCLDPRDELSGGLPRRSPGIYWIWDYDGSVSRLLGAIPVDSMPGDDGCLVRRFWLLLDPSLHVVAVIPFADEGSDELKLVRLLRTMHGLAPWRTHPEVGNSKSHCLHCGSHEQFVA